MSRLRAAVPVFLIAIGLLGVLGAFLAESFEWRAVWVGVASTGLSAGLVDGSAVLEARRREQTILRIAGQRVGFIHQRLIWVLYATFDVPRDDPAALPRQLREIEDGVIDLTEPADVVPPRTKQVLVMQCVDEIDGALDVALRLGAETSEVARFARLDRALRSGPFSLFLSITVPLSPRVEPASVIAGQAADVLDVVQSEFRFFSRQAGPGWGYGRL